LANPSELGGLDEFREFLPIWARSASISPFARSNAASISASLVNASASAAAWVTTSAALLKSSVPD
jgi:hypothetical protein